MQTVGVKQEDSDERIIAKEYTKKKISRGTNKIVSTKA